VQTGFALRDDGSWLRNGDQMINVIESGLRFQKT
jgi:hypothetical protein